MTEKPVSQMWKEELLQWIKPAPGFKIINQHQIKGEVEVTLPLTLSESKELKNALEVVNKYKNEAFKVVLENTKNDPSKSEWCMVDYMVEEGKVIVNITDGMAG